MERSKKKKVLLVGSSHYHLTKNNDKFLKWYYQKLEELFPGSQPNDYEFNTINPFCMVTENNQVFMCRHFFLSFGEPEAREWFEDYQGYYDLVVFEGTPHEMNQKIVNLEWVSEILRDKGFYFYVCNLKICTDELVIEKFHKTLGEIKQIYALSELKIHAKVWQKNSQVMHHPNRILPNTNPVPTIKEAMNMSEKELMRYHVLYHDKEHRYFYDIYHYQKLEDNINKLMKNDNYISPN
jgi:hypothetical protein